MKEMINGVVGDNANCASASEKPQQQADVHIPPRRPRARVREVSSRFMSPLVPSSNAGPTPGEYQQRSKSVHRRLHHPEEDQDSLSSTSTASRVDEKNSNNVLEATRSLDRSPLVVPFGSHNKAASSSMSSVHRKTQQQSQMQRPKVSKENSQGGGKAEQQHPSRPDTPIDRDRIVPSRYRLNSQIPHRPTETNRSSEGGAAVTAAARLLQEATLSNVPQNSCGMMTNESNDGRAMLLQKKLSRLSRSKDDSCDSSNTTASAQQLQQGGSCPSSPICVSSNKNRTNSFSDVRSSMPEVDILPTLSAASPCSRSLVFPMSRGEHSSSTSSWHCLRGSDMTSGSSPSKPSVKNQMGSLCLPPHPSIIKLGADARKGRKQQEEVYSLKLLYNHYLKWRFANAKAEASMRAREMETEGQLNSLGSKLSEMRDAVMRKRIELGHLQRLQAFSTIVESQMSYLDRWSAMKDDYSSSLSGVETALLNLSLRLPVSGEVKVDVKGLGEAFNSALKMMEMISFHINSFMVKAEDTEMLLADLARVVGGERALVEECGDLLFKAYASQVEECSLRGHLFQVHSSNNRRSQQLQKFSSKQVTCSPLIADYS